MVGDVRLADDQGMVSSSEDGLQRLMVRLNETANIYLQHEDKCSENQSYASE